jgi:hypothetical protein
MKSASCACPPAREKAINQSESKRALSFFRCGSRLRPSAWLRPFALRSPPHWSSAAPFSRLAESSRAERRIREAANKVSMIAHRRKICDLTNAKTDPSIDQGIWCNLPVSSLAFSFIHFPLPVLHFIFLYLILCQK